MVEYTKELNVIMGLCTFVMWLKFLITLFIGGSKSHQTGNRTKEDLKSDKNYNEVTQEMKDEEIRWWYIELNDIENLPYALIIFWAARYLVVNNSGGQLTLCIAFPIYVVVRILHTFAFANAWLILRVICFATSLTCMMVAGLDGIVCSFIDL